MIIGRPDGNGWLWRTQGRRNILRKHGFQMPGGPMHCPLGHYRWLLSNQTGFYARDLAVGELVCEEPLLIEAFDLSQIPVHL